MFATKNALFRRRVSLIAAHAFVLGIAGAGTYAAFAGDTAPVAIASTAAPVPVDLEQAFWACDYVATTYGVQAAPVEFCSEVSSALREQKFDGDFGRLLEWWKANKPVQHARF